MKEGCMYAFQCEGCIHQKVCSEESRNRALNKECSFYTEDRDYVKCADDILMLDRADDVINKRGVLIAILKRHFTTPKEN